MIDVETKSGRPVTNFADSDVRQFYWTNNRRLLFSVGDTRDPADQTCFFGWYAVNSDGSDLRLLEAKATHSISASPRAPGTPDAATFAARIPSTSACPRDHRRALRDFRFLSADPNDGDDIVIEARELSRRTLDVYRVNTKSGEMKLLSTEQPSSKIFGWTVDRNGVPRLAVSHDQGITTLWYREGGGRAWMKLDEGDFSKPTIEALAFDFDNRTLYVGFPEQGDKFAVYRYDFEKRQPGERLARHLDVDMGLADIDMDALLFNRAKRKLVGFAFDADKRGVVWLDEDIARLQQMVDRALGTTVNVLRVADANPKRALITAYSDVRPAEYYVIDAEKLSITKFASSRPWIKSEEMSQRKFVRYKASDGKEIPAYLTIPKQSSGKALPLVVDIHDGPWRRKQSWDFNSNAQFFASRGYAVLQPDFRGTFGYGWRHFESSLKQWGLAMQDDITDGVEWLVREGVADKNRICLFGGGYGGYATLWGLMKTPELYRCGVAFSAVTDIQLYFNITWSSLYWSPYDWLDYGAKVLIGDPDVDRDKFRSVSPLYQAARLKAPILLAFGGVDHRVPLEHGTAFREALDRSGKKYEWVVYSHEGHGFNEDKNRFDFYRRVEAFLKQHLN